MKKIKNLMVLTMLFIGSTLFASETFESSEAGCKITFPNDFSTETDDSDGTKTITISSSMGNMLYMLVVSIYSEPVAEDDNDLTEATTLFSFASRVSAKVKTKNVYTFKVGAEKGFTTFLKCKLSGKKYQGKYYVICKGNKLYQYTALGLKKYDERTGNDFVGSFRFVD